jgi:phosphopantetheine--protein transferase-like protein
MSAAMVTIGWLTQTEEDLPLLPTWLSKRELDHLASLRFEKRRKEWQLGRWTAKLAVVEYLNNITESDNGQAEILVESLTPVLQLSLPKLMQIEILAAADGAPQVFFNGKLLDYTLSLSHREQRAFCAITQSYLRMGCDLEFIEQHSKAFLKDFFTNGEYHLLDETIEPLRTKLIALVWSAKESALKALGVGLQFDTRDMEVRLAKQGIEEQTFTVSCKQEHDLGFNGWWWNEGKYLFTIAVAR